MGPITEHIIIASRVVSDRQPGDCVVVRTPLDLIRVLDDQPTITTVILADGFATDPAIREFLGDEYPWLRVVAIDAPRFARRHVYGAHADLALAE